MEEKMPKQEKQKLQIVILEHGYVEENTNWMNMFITSDLKGSVQELLESLAKPIIDGMHDPDPYIWKECCKKAKKAKKVPTYCPDCGSRLKQAALDIEDFERVAWAYLKGHADGTHDAWEKLGDACWFPLGDACYQLGGEAQYPEAHPFMNDPTIIYIYEYGSTLLAAAYMNKLLSKDKRDKDYSYDFELEKHLKLFGGDAKNMKIFKED
jgi:hypothetical protein